MSEADKMFTQLGYKKDTCTNAIEYVLNNDKEISFVENVDTKQNEIWINSFNVITVQELQAINKKCKELGWNVAN